MMPPYNEQTNRDNPGGGALIPQDQSREIIKEAAQQSGVLSTFKKTPILGQQKRFPVMASRPMAYFLDPTSVPANDTALIPTTSMEWKNVVMNVTEIATIAPMPRRFLNDAAANGVNVTAEMRPYLAEALATKLDGAVFFGISKPDVWPLSMYHGALAAGNKKVIEAGPSEGGLHSDILKTMRVLRGDGFRASAGIGDPLFEYDVLDARDVNGQPIWKPTDATAALGTGNGNLLGRNVMFGLDGVFPAAAPGTETPQLMLYDATKFMVGMPEDIYMTIHTEGIIEDEAGNRVYNLMQMDMIAVRLIMRVGIAVANPTTLANPDENTRYPAAVLVSSSEAP